MSASTDVQEDVAEARLLAVLTELERCASSVADRTAAAARSSSPQGRRSAVAVLDRVTARLSTARGRLLVAEKQSLAWRGRGDPTFEAWRGRTSKEGRTAAGQEIRRAETLDQLPALATAAEAGAVTLEHVDVVARATRTAPARVREVLATPQGQADVLAMARRNDAGSFKDAFARWAATQDPAAHERNHQAQRAARFLHLAETPDGTRLTGLLDRMAGHRLRLALEAASPRPAADDDRSSEQRRADALLGLADHALARPADDRSGAAVRPHVSFVMTEDTWAGLRRTWRSQYADDGTRPDDLGAAWDTGPAGEAPPGVPAIPRLTPVVTEDGVPVPLSEVARTLCDCTLTRVVVDADSEPVDLGRTERLYTGAQRRAVVVRDGGCAWPTCGAPARWGEVHHIRWWDRDTGPTSVANGVLLCSFHHHEVHRRDLRIRRTGTAPRADGAPVAHARYEFRRPDGTPLADHPGVPTRHELGRPGASPPDAAGGSRDGDERTSGRPTASGVAGIRVPAQRSQNRSASSPRSCGGRSPAHGSEDDDPPRPPPRPGNGLW